LIATATAQILQSGRDCYNYNLHGWIICCTFAADFGNNDSPIHRFTN